MSARFFVLVVLATTVALGSCAKRYEGSLKDDAATAHPAPARIAHTGPRVKAQPTAVTRPQPQALAKEPHEPCASSERCAEELRAMLNDQTRSWIGKPQSVQEHLTGTRQFAYLALLQVMSCQQLSAGLKDVQTSAQVPLPTANYAPRIIAQIKDLDTHVVGELRKELAARCPR